MDPINGLPCTSYYIKSGRQSGIGKRKNLEMTAKFENQRGILWQSKVKTSKQQLY